MIVLNITGSPVNQTLTGARSPAIPRHRNEPSSSGTALPFTGFLQPPVGSPGVITTLPSLYTPRLIPPDHRQTFPLTSFGLTVTNAQVIKPTLALELTKKVSSIIRAEAVDLSRIKGFDFPSASPPKGVLSNLTPCLKRQQ